MGSVEVGIALALVAALMANLAALLLPGRSERLQTRGAEPLAVRIA